MLLDEGLNTPNGITVSPDDRRVYVAQRLRNNILVYDRRPDGTLHHKRVFIDFLAQGVLAHAMLDGMRCDIRGNVYVAMFRLGRILIVGPDGTLHPKAIQTIGDRPANLTFCGADRRTL